MKKTTIAIISILILSIIAGTYSIASTQKRSKYGNRYYSINRPLTQRYQTIEPSLVEDEKELIKPIKLKNAKKYGRLKVVDNKVVIDTKTKKMWERSQAFQIKWGTKGTLYSFQLNYLAAENYCKNLRIGSYDDWKLPTVKDFKTLQQSLWGDNDKSSDLQKVRNSWNTIWNNNFLSSKSFWTSTSQDKNNKKVEAINFTTGKQITAFTKYEYAQARCIREISK